MEIEIATMADIPRLCELLVILLEQEREFAPDPVRQAAGLSRIIGKSAVGAVFVARAGGRIIGMASILYTVSTFLGAKVALLEDMIVEPAFRRKGVGSVLMAAALAKAEVEGCRRLTLLTDADNEAGHAFYKKHGFSSSTMLPFRKLL